MPNDPDLPTVTAAATAATLKPAAFEATLEASIGKDALEASVSVASKATFSLPLLRVVQFLRQAGPSTS